MPLTNALDDVPRWTAAELSSIPGAEDESHEYKSSLISPQRLGDALGFAASGFWNTGGGLFVAGVGGDGRPDGGIEVRVGRQPIRDWVDQKLKDVAPSAEYRVQVIDDATLGLAPGRGVLVVAFGESHVAPHMAPDRRYYIRAGAHTVPAPHFVVEALLARRGLAQPLLRPVVRRKPGVGAVLQVGIVAVTSAPALDAVITVPPLEFLDKNESTVLEVGVITTDIPMFFDAHIQMLGSKPLAPFSVDVSYRDVAGRQYETAFNIDFAKQSGISLLGARHNEELTRELDKIEKAVKAVASGIAANGRELQALGRKLR